MRQLFQRLFRDYLQGGSLFERIGKDLGWSEANPSDLLHLRQRVLTLDPENELLERENRTSSFAQKYPLLKKLFPPNQVYQHQSRHCQMYLQALHYGQDLESRDIIELLVGLPQPFDRDFEFAWLGLDPETRASSQSAASRPTTNHRGAYAQQAEQLIRRSEALQDALRKLYLSPFVSLLVNDRGLRLHFDDRLNLGQGRRLLEAAIEISDLVAEARLGSNKA